MGLWLCKGFIFLLCFPWLCLSLYLLHFFKPLLYETCVLSYSLEFGVIFCVSWTNSDSLFGTQQMLLFLLKVFLRKTHTRALGFLCSCCLCVWGSGESQVQAQGCYRSGSYTFHIYGSQLLCTLLLLRMTFSSHYSFSCFIEKLLIFFWTYFIVSYLNIIFKCFS